MFTMHLDPRVGPSSVDVAAKGRPVDCIRSGQGRILPSLQRSGDMGSGHAEDPGRAGGGESTNAEVREAVVESLAFSGGQELLPKFEAALKREGDREVKSDLEDAIESFKRQAAKTAAAGASEAGTHT